ncbi:MAG TPA: phosphoglycolate phosphatase [Candidatus Cybelea sp.]|nr:phosphoglycolate phosphatase [Candidatus Cybelea sp.]
MQRTAILFDLDGTLVDTAPDICAALNWVLEKRRLPPIDPASVRTMIGDGAAKLVERGLVAAGAQSPDVQQAAVADFLTHYQDNISRLSRPFPGAVDALAALKASQYRLAVCTNKLERFTVKLLDDLNMTHFFDAIVGGDTLGVQKPDARHLLGTLQRLGAEAANAAMVGDSANDVSAARNAGVPVIAVSFGYTKVAPQQLGADRLIDSFSELLAALRALR